MSINPIQFQPGLSMADFIRQYGTEAKCYRALYKARWPQGFRCACCQHRSRSRFRREGRVYYQCRACRHQTTLVSGTMFENTKLPLTAWFLAMHLLTATKTNLSALELKRHLGVNYKAAWRLKHKIMQAMTDHEETRQLAGFVQLDDAYLGGERDGGKRGRGAEGKQPFVVAVSCDAHLERPTFAVIEPIRAFDNASLRDFTARRLAQGAEVFSDGLACFAQVVEQDHPHTVLITGGGRAATEVQGARWVNVLLSNLKRAISGRYHAFRQAKYARRYLAEAAYRFNHRFRLSDMLQRLLHHVALCKPCAEPTLRAACNFLG